METNSKSNGEALGAEPTLNDVERAVKRDLNNALGLLNAVVSDPDFLRYVATFAHGRYINAQNAKKAQHELDLK